MSPAAPRPPPRRGRFPSPAGPLTAPGPKRRGAPAAGPSPRAAEPPTPGARARCGDTRPASHPRPGGGVTAAASAREDAAGRGPCAAEPARCPQGGEGTGWARGLAAASKVPLERGSRSQAAPQRATRILDPPGPGSDRACLLRRSHARSQDPLRGLAAAAARLTQRALQAGKLSPGKWA
ncbi:skin secretory protein xP2-like [Hyaena hyaena]|uniref:skin secretory protein xP2-like n=1 Tax=Hyaena hyaena TaxID=95912 RepID=UPI0019239171|nr:skin secretory protein xP2-like [Hyaena hyaena]